MQNSALHRAADCETSVMAAERILSKLSELQRAVLRALRREHQRTANGMTDRELESLPEFSQRAPSTIRRRRTDLVKKGLARHTGAMRDRMRVWTPVPLNELAERTTRDEAESLF